MYWVGFNQVGLPVVKRQRDGHSTYSTKKRLELMIQAITSFSGKPLEYLFYTGLIITFGSVLTITFFLIKKIIYGDAIQLGYTSLVTINILILGILSLAFIGFRGLSF